MQGRHEHLPISSASVAAVHQCLKAGDRHPGPCHRRILATVNRTLPNFISRVFKWLFSWWENKTPEEQKEIIDKIIIQFKDVLKHYYDQYKAESERERKA